MPPEGNGPQLMLATAFGDVGSGEMEVIERAQPASATVMATVAITLLQKAQRMSLTIMTATYQAVGLRFLWPSERTT